MPPTTRPRHTAARPRTPTAPVIQVPAPVVKVNMPKMQVLPPVVNVAAPAVQVPAPVVKVAAPAVTLPAPVVHVHVDPPAKPAPKTAQPLTSWVMLGLVALFGVPFACAFLNLFLATSQVLWTHHPVFTGLWR